eukprot:2843795-Pleurochrysis_carterae.AAC.1
MSGNYARRAENSSIVHATAALVQAGLGDADYLAAFDLIVLPILMEFDPQLILVSAGELVMQACSRQTRLRAAFSHLLLLSFFITAQQNRSQSPLLYSFSF